MTDQEREDLQCDVLLLIATPTEEKMLKVAAKAMGLDFERKTIPNLGEYFRLGILGRSKANAVRTELGPFSHRRSASIALHYRTATQAAAIIQLGMAFGVDPKTQGIGDVLVSTSLIPYDLREVRPLGAVSRATPTGTREIIDPVDAVPIHTPNQATEHLEPIPATNSTDKDQENRRTYKVDYKWALRHPAKPSLIHMFTEERNRKTCPHQVFLGGMLSGGARIFSRQFLQELVTGVPQAEDGIIGGEMEGVGLLSVSPPNDPIWIVVKGISDFADEERDTIIKKTRPVACEHSAKFVLSALANTKPQ